MRNESLIPEKVLSKHCLIVIIAVKNDFCNLKTKYTINRKIIIFIDVFYPLRE